MVIRWVGREEARIFGGKLGIALVDPPSILIIIGQGRERDRKERRKTLIGIDNLAIVPRIIPLGGGGKGRGRRPIGVSSMQGSDPRYMGSLTYEDPNQPHVVLTGRNYYLVTWGLKPTSRICQVADHTLWIGEAGSRSKQ